RLNPVLPNAGCKCSSGTPDTPKWLKCSGPVCRSVCSIRRGYHGRLCRRCKQRRSRAFAKRSGSGHAAVECSGQCTRYRGVSAGPNTRAPTEGETVRRDGTRVEVYSGAEGGEFHHHHNWRPSNYDGVLV